MGRIEVHIRVFGYTDVKVHVWVYIFIRTGAKKGTDSRKKYGVATMSKLLKIVGLFCRISPLL